MSATPQIPDGLEVFAALSPTELTVLAAKFVQTDLEPGTVVFREGDPGDAMYIVQDGAVEVVTRITADVEKTLLTLRAGGVFGELSLLTGETRSATARVSTKTALLAMDAPAFGALVEEEPVIARKLLENLTATIARRLNITTELYRRAVAWGVEISGVVQLNFNQLITESIDLAIELVSGKTVRGTLLKAEQGPAGYEFLVKTEADEFVIVPYHAVMGVSFAAADVPRNDEE